MKARCFLERFQDKSCGRAAKAAFGRVEPAQGALPAACRLAFTRPGLRGGNGVFQRRAMGVWLISFIAQKKNVDREQ